MQRSAMNEPLLIGNNMALLVAACELSRRGRKVTMLADGKPLGGHFSGLKVEGHSFDLGMVLLEKLTSTQRGADLASYNAARRNDWIRAGVDGRPLHWCRFGLSGGDGQWHSRTGIASWHVFDRCYVFHPLGFAWAPRGSFIRARRRGGSSSGSSPCRTGR